MRGSLDATESRATAGQLLGPDTVRQCILFNWAGFTGFVEDPTITQFDLEKWPCGTSLGAVDDDAADACLVIAAPVGPALSREALIASVAGIASSRRVSIIGVNQRVVNRAVRQILEVFEPGGSG
jgi:hypothetical protein